MGATSHKRCQICHLILGLYLASMQRERRTRKKKVLYWFMCKANFSQFLMTLLVQNVQNLCISALPLLIVFNTTVLTHFWQFACCLISNKLFSSQIPPFNQSFLFSEWQLCSITAVVGQSHKDILSYDTCDLTANSFHLVLSIWYGHCNRRRPGSCWETQG